MNLMPTVKSNAVAEFGDFQTPRMLAGAVCSLLADLGIAPASIVEPTCGTGGFLFAAADRWPSSAIVLGFEINPVHLRVARERASSRPDATRIRLNCADFFKTDWSRLLGGLPAPILVIGNPPWVTNAHVSSLNGSNVPDKSNFQGHNGLDAITGKANFDISEWMLIKLAEELSGRDAVLAMLVKTAVARKLLHHCWKNGYSVTQASIFNVDAEAHFNAAVDASLIVLTFGCALALMRADVYGQLTKAIAPTSTIGLAGGVIVADFDAWERTHHLRAASPLKWRSGIKHDCSKVMEFQIDGGQLRNGFGQAVDLEDEYLFPMLKTSEVARGKTGHCKRRMLVPQRRIGEITSDIAIRAPKTWAYLQSHRERLSRRGSSIYRDKPDFSIFGVGEYSFAPWKVAVSGMYKSLRFTIVGPHEGKPTVLDDITNFMPCQSEAGASLLHSMLASQPAQMFFRAYIFWDAKRPITVELLSRLNLHALASELGNSAEFERHFGPPVVPTLARKPRNRPAREAPMFWTT